MTPKIPYTVIIRRSVQELVGVCLELNISARGRDLEELEINLKNAIADYLDYLRDESATASPIPVDELVEFLKDTTPESETPDENQIYRALELNEVPVNV